MACDRIRDKIATRDRIPGPGSRAAEQPRSPLVARGGTYGKREGTRATNRKEALDPKANRRKNGSLGREPGPKCQERAGGREAEVPRESGGGVWAR